MEENTPKAQDGSLEDDDRITHEASQALNGSPLKIHTGKASSDDESEEKEEKEEKDESSACDDSPDSAALRKKRTKPWDRWKNRTDDQSVNFGSLSSGFPLTILFIVESQSGGLPLRKSSSLRCSCYPTDYPSRAIP